MTKAALLLIDVQVGSFEFLPNSSYPVDMIFIIIAITQKDFHSGGSLAVPGADADSLRIAEMIE